MAGEVDTIVNLAKTGWEIVKDNKPSSAAQTAYCQAMPAKNQLAWEELAGWKTKSFSWPFKMYTHLDNLLGMDPSIDIEFYGEYQYGGEAETVPGQFLNNFTVWCKKVHVDIPWTVNVNAAIQGNPFNAGSRQKPIGAIQLRVMLDRNHPTQAKTTQWAITWGGDGSFRTS
jgi:hypothetical protein